MHSKYKFISGILLLTKYKHFVHFMGGCNEKSIGRSICVLLCLFTLASALSGCGGGGGQKAVSLSAGWYAAPADTLDEETAVKGFAEGEALTLSQACMETGPAAAATTATPSGARWTRAGGPGPAPPARYLRRRETVAQRPGADADPVIDVTADQKAGAIPLSCAAAANSFHRAAK